MDVDNKLEKDADQIVDEIDRKAQPKKVQVLTDPADPSVASFIFLDEDHTLGNVLRHYLTKNPETEFAGYNVPHPLINKMSLRVQTTSDENAIDTLKRTCLNVQSVCRHMNATLDDVEKEFRKK
mmetsp:Transcript_18435/g.32044  ORF Transcript_18435/g.32044 Transcript_18435/m.32044 type:complete len:124 (-) Transcript_18435:137-508(-)